MIEEINEVPLVVSDKIQEVKKTKEAVRVLRRLKAWTDVEKVRLTCIWVLALHLDMRKIFLSPPPPPPNFQSHMPLNFYFLSNLLYEHVSLI